MSKSIGRFAAVLGTVALLVGTALPASAKGIDFDSQSSRTSAAGDAMLLRPFGLIATVLGTGLFVATLPFYAITRPSEIDKPFKVLVVAPAKFTWVDPLGSH